MQKKFTNITLILVIISLILTYSILAAKASKECKNEGGKWVSKVEGGFNNAKQTCKKG